MANRKFEDPYGDGWEVVPESDRRWRLEPLDDDQLPRVVTPPSDAADPFELSEKELQQMLVGGRPSGETRRRLPDTEDET